MMLPVEKLWDPSNRTPVLAISAGMIALIAIVDWWTVPFVSLGLLYLFPIILAAGFLSRPAVSLLGVLCAAFSEAFSSLDPAWSVSRLILETLALGGCGLFASELLRNRRLSLQMQQRLAVLVETSPAAIVTVDQQGRIELANRAAIEMMAPAEANLLGQPVGELVPALRDAFGKDDMPPFRASMQCQVRRGNGETFIGDVWFSIYREQGVPKLAAIIADVTEEQLSGLPSVPVEPLAIGRPNLNHRQLAVLRMVLAGHPNTEIAARLEMTASAVKNTLQQLYAKTGVHNRSQMVRFALERYRDLL